LPAYEDTRTIKVAAAPAQCFAVLTDYESMPQWQSRVCECTVLETDAAGRGSVVEYAIDAKLRIVRYRLRHLYEEPTWIGSEYLDGDFRQFAGDYRFAQGNGATTVTFTLRIDPGMRIPGAVARMLGQVVLAKSLQDVKRRVEEVARGAQ
jgi:ribosome-associated toxin RatA of RatAB toxin-antitoxin module